ncbi:MAG: hypothetical protein AAF491_02935, partial [Verrucomicrobiota bacterium]
MKSFALTFLLLFFAAVPANWAQEGGTGSSGDLQLETEGPAELLERGRKAFLANDFATAEEALEKFILYYGEAEEAKEAARLHRPLVAISKVGLKKFGEALEWIATSLEDPQIELSLKDELMFWQAICFMTTG